MPGPPPNSREPAPKVLVVSPDPAVASELTPLLGRELPGTAVVRIDTYPAGAALTTAAAMPGLRLCFVDVCSDRQAALGFLAEAGARAPSLAVIALLLKNDPDLILHCLRQGAAEFLVRPFTGDQLQTALAKLNRTQTAPVPLKDLARVLCVLPGKGACGSTTLACNLASQLAPSSNGRLLLADLDPLTGTLAFLLKLRSNYSFLDALSRAASLDADLWKSIVTPCQGLDVLLSPENPVDGITEACDPTPVLRYARKNYDTVVLDIGGPYGSWNLAVVGLSDELLVVTTNELAALNATQRAIAHLEGHGIERSRMRLIVNRWSPQIGLQREQIEKALRMDVYGLLPSDYEAIQRSLLDGRPAAAHTRFGKAIAEVGDRLLGRERSDRKGSVLSRLFGRPVSLLTRR